MKTVDEYIAAAPKELQGKLKQLRSIIKEMAPEAEEKLSYSMPYYGYKGRLVYFAYATNHIGLYLIPPMVENHKEELKQYVTSKSTIQLPLDQELPVALIKKLIKESVKQNEKKAK
jgi:uncharacterized protein YdhG (YjbR/CyaY superfamily)